MAAQPWRMGKVIRVVNETANTRRYWVEVPELSSFDFQPGQFVTLDLPIHEKVNKRWRSYSIASWPDGSNIFEMVIVLAEGGAGSTYIFNHYTTGTELLFRGAQGVFTLPPVLDKDLFLVCTGTGIAPFRSMLHHIHRHHIPRKNVYLIFGCRKKEDLLYYEEIKELVASQENLHYIPTLSREHWEGRHGYVHPIYTELCADKQPADFYLCGWKHMIDEARKRILEMGYDKKSIHVELYG
ncbi:MAG TPA: FAD-dependent oxidoreductase [Chitinophagaceae bacterium]|nr:FAD-dependent oxidoreductase [Chitinophagaceae bacterium]